MKIFWRTKLVNLKEREIISPTIEQDEPMDSSAGEIVLEQIKGDIFIVNLGWKNSANLDSIIELGKTIITLMLGYLFATDKHST